MWRHFDIPISWPVLIPAAIAGVGCAAVVPEVVAAGGVVAKQLLPFSDLTSPFSHSSQTTLEDCEQFAQPSTTHSNSGVTKIKSF